MLSMSLGVSFSGLLHCIAESVVLVLSELIDQNSVKLLRKFLPRKKIELASPEMGLDSEFKNFKAANSSSCKHATSSSADSIMKQEHLFPDLRNEGPWSSKEELNQYGLIISYPRKRVCSNFCKGKAVLQASEAEDLNTRLEILEEESQIMKQALLETMAERKKLVNEIYKLFETRRYTLLPKDQEDGHTFSSGSLIIKPCKGPGQGTAESSLLHALLENPRSEDPNTNALAILGQSYISTQ
ncbi:hypothetical protein ERO13_A05G122100v2 [Gossypium hirsutum]|nr:hypothetical protein ERO13_A05G122100v2 [Gossypium hirsutum]